MIGDVWEWVNAAIFSAVSRASRRSRTRSTPKCSSDHEYKMLRGGSWATAARSHSQHLPQLGLPDPPTDLQRLPLRARCAGTARDLERFTLDVHTRGQPAQHHARRGARWPDRATEVAAVQVLLRCLRIGALQADTPRFPSITRRARSSRSCSRWPRRRLHCTAGDEVVEIGSGSSKKTLTILDALNERGFLKRFVPIDVSESILRESAEALLRRYPTIHVHGVIGDFMAHLGAVPPSDGRRLVVFLGSTIGNLDVPGAIEPSYSQCAACSGRMITSWLGWTWSRTLRWSRPLTTTARA